MYDTQETSSGPVVIIKPEFLYSTPWFDFAALGVCSTTRTKVVHVEEGGLAHPLNSRLFDRQPPRGAGTETWTRSKGPKRTSCKPYKRDCI